ncbi:MAG: tetratricopeptide repeat protein [Cyclobacteriaceae bacterium]|nr:tetratricopeptide repeat protein [Cyclobacteriaceae bacterium]
MHNAADQEAAGQILLERGRAFEVNSLYHLALIAYYSSLNFSTLPENRGKTYLGLSNVNFRMGDFTQALEHSIHAIDIFLENGDTTNLIGASMLKGQVYIYRQDYGDALQLYEDMLELASARDELVLIADILDHIGAIYSFKKQFQTSLSYHLRALKINQKINHKRNESINHANIGEVYLRLHDYAMAFKYLDMSLKIARETNFKSLLIFIHYTLAEAYSLTGESIKAMKHFNQSLRLIGELSETVQKPHVLLLISEHYERNYQYEIALNYYKRYNTLNDSLSNQRAEYRTEELKTLHELNIKEQSLRAVELEKLLQQKELNTSRQTIRFQFIIILLVVVGLISSVWFTIYFYKNQRKLPHCQPNQRHAVFHHWSRLARSGRQREAVDRAGTKYGERRAKENTETDGSAGRFGF